MEQSQNDFQITVPKTVLLLIAYIAIGFGVPVIFDTVFEKLLAPSVSVWIGTFAQLAVNIAFFLALAGFTKYKVSFSSNITVVNILLAIACAILLFLLLDCFIDPLFNRLFPTSEIRYQEMLDAMRLTPVATFIQACLIAPLTEELMMRGYILHGLKNRHGAIIALFLSTFLFAILHINVGQIASAFIGGILIALVYLKTKSLSCCILAHILYNTIEFFMTIV